MPLMPPLLQKSIAFVYRNVRDAREDNNFQAVGFFVRVPSAAQSGGYTYFITNWHVIRELPQKFVIRINTKCGFKAIQLETLRFIANQEYDIAASYVSLQDEALDFAYISSDDVLRDWNVDQANALPWVGPGDDVVMPCRIVAKTKYKSQNVSVLRFGNISLCPLHEEKAFVVEMRSIAGHSGSPVLYFDMGLQLHGLRTNSPRRWSLLGINRGHLRIYEEVVKVSDIARGIAHRKPATHYVASNMAMSQVIPSWKILELLEHETFRNQREVAERRIASAAKR